MENKNDGIQSSTGGKTKSLPNPPIILKRIKKKIKIKTWCWWDLEDKVHATLLNQFLLRFNPRRTRYPFEYFFRRSLCCFKVVSFDCICTVYTASSDSDELIGYTRSDKPPFFPNIKTCALVFSLYLQPCRSWVRTVSAAVALEMVARPSSMKSRSRPLSSSGRRLGLLDWSSPMSLQYNCKYHRTQFIVFFSFFFY